MIYYKNTKVKKGFIDNSYISINMLYGSETWSIIKNQISGNLVLQKSEEY